LFELLSTTVFLVQAKMSKVTWTQKLQLQNELKLDKTIEDMHDYSNA